MTEVTHLVIRADGGLGIGNGHLGRCLALAESWLEGGDDVTLASDSVPTDWSARWRRAGASIAPADAVASAGAGWVVFDGYGLDSACHAAARRAGALVGVIDDHGTVGNYAEADLVVDQNLNASAAAYRTRRSGSTLLLGSRYALLRREFRRRAEPPRPVRDKAESIIVLLGGSPPERARAIVDAALSDRRLQALRNVTSRKADQLADAMAVADVALSAAGSTCWELSHMGVPAVLFSLSGNQRPLAASLAAKGAAVDAGWYGDVDPAALAREVCELAADAPRRRTMSARARAIVDGRGAPRVAAHLRAPLLALRRVAPADSRTIWAWANDGETRAASFSSDPIPLATHEAWLAARLSDPRCHFFMASDRGGAAVGQVRFQSSDTIDRHGAEISVSVAPACRGRRWGPALVLAGIARYRAEGGKGSILARVKPSNAASVSVFEDSGFRREAGAVGPSGSPLRYVLADDDG